MITRYFWQALNSRAAVLWHERESGEDRSTEGPMGLVMWGLLDAAALRFSLSELSFDRAGYPVWEREEPPSESELERAWRESSGARFRAYLESLQELALEGLSVDELEDMPERTDLEDLLRHTVKGLPADALPPFRRRARSETADDFYARVAKFYKGAVAIGQPPLVSLQENARVPKTTAARWVREARARGFLALTTRGRTSR
jgi:hypothetical protein